MDRTGTGNDWYPPRVSDSPRRNTTVIGLQDLAMSTLRQELPEDIEWIPWTSMPRLHWHEDGSLADERIVRGWLIAAVLRGAPTPDLEMTRHAACFDPDDDAMLATWLLDAWIAHDTTPVPPLTDERHEALRDIAARGAELAVRLGREGKDPAARYRELVAVENNHLAPSGHPHKGLLAVVAACTNGDVVQRIRETVARYRDTWSATRPARCRALADMLLSVDRSIEANYST